jgi:hypothetical protein
MFWLVFRTESSPYVILQPASTLIHARLVASVNGATGEFQEGHQLDKKIVKKIPPALIGKPLSGSRRRSCWTGFRELTPGRASLVLLPYALP